jgi:CheY-like chemotaxis protein
LFKSVGYIGLQDEPARLSPSTCHQSVLLVDDNRDAAHTTGMLLRALGHEVTVRHDGLAALQFLEQTMPQVVLLDIGLPGLNGYEVARRLRAMPGGERVRLYAMTGYGQEEDQRRSAAAGFDGHLVKPLLPQDLVAALEAG